MKRAFNVFIKMATKTCSGSCIINYTYLLPLAKINHMYSIRRRDTVFDWNPSGLNQVKCVVLFFNVVVTFLSSVVRLPSSTVLGIIYLCCL